MKRQRANRRAAPIASYRGKGRWEWMQLALAGALALAGLVLVIVRVWGMRFSGFLLLGIAALLVMNVLLDRLTAENSRWRLARRIFRSCVAVGLALLVGLEAVILNRGCSDMTPLPADSVIVLGAGVNGTEPSLSLRTRLDKALEYLEYWEDWSDIPVVLTGGTGYGEAISEAACMYNYLTEHGVEPERLILEDRASNTAENFAFSKELLAAAGVDPAADKVAVITNDFHLARAELIAARQGYGDTAGIPAPLPWPHLTVNYYLREAFAMVKSLAFD